MDKSSYILYVDSEDRSGGDSASDFYIDFNPAIEVSQLVILSFNCPFSWYAVNSSNNKFTFSDTTSNVVTATISVGNYTADEMCTELAAQMGAVGTGTYTVTFDTKTNKFTISADGNFALCFGMGTNQINELLGFDTTTLLAATEIPAAYTAQLTGPDYLFVRSNQLSASCNRAIVNKKQSTVIYKVDIERMPGETVVRATNLADYSVTLPTKRVLTRVDFQLTFPDGTIVDLNGRNWSIALKVYQD